MTMTAPETPRRSPKVTAPHRGGPVRCGHGHANAEPVTKDGLGRVDNHHHTIGRHMRLTHCIDLDTLIIKIPGPTHEIAHITFGQELTFWSRMMGLPPDEFV